MRHIAYVAIRDGDDLRFVTSVDWEDSNVFLYPGEAAVGFDPCMARDVERMLPDKLALVIFAQKPELFKNPDDAKYLHYHPMTKEEYDTFAAAMARIVGEQLE